MGPDALIALVRLLARQAAREFALQAPAPSRQKQPQPGGSEMTDAPDFLRAGDIARLAGVSVRTVRRWIAEKTLPSVKVRGARLVPRKDLERMLSPRTAGLCRAHRRNRGKQRNYSYIGKHFSQEHVPSVV